MNERGEVKRSPHHDREKYNKKQIGFDTFDNTSAWQFKNVIDNVVVVLKEHNGSKSDIKSTYVAQFIGVCNESIDVIHNDCGLCWHEVAKNKFLHIVIHLLKKWQCGKDIK